MGKTESITSQYRYSKDDVRAGARNLLINGANVKIGTDVLIVNQPGLVEPAVADILEQEARALGAKVYAMWADGIKGPEQLPQPLMAAMKDCEVTVWLAQSVNTA